MSGQRLPSVDAVLSSETLSPLISRWGRPLALQAVRAVQTRLRADPSSRPAWSADADGYGPAVEAELRTVAGIPPAPVINMSGTLIHSNLGRAPLSADVARAVAEQAEGASNLEFDLGSGRRGSRESYISAALCALTGAEAATVVNNGAAGLLLILNTLALQRPVPVSRGELIEIGGSFRLPAIMERAGAQLVEVGTTNRTRLADYADALTDETALLLKVHPSNYRIEGFTATVSIGELAGLASQHSLPLVEDLGSGALLDYSAWGYRANLHPGDSLEAGADLVLVSGDKLLGGPQAGIIVGRADLIGELNRNPLKRALRLDRLRLTALAEVLKRYGRGADSVAELPVAALIAQPLAAVQARAERLAKVVSAQISAPWTVTVIDSACEIGSGALPGTRLPSAAVALQCSGGGGKALSSMLAALRALPTPVVGRIADDAVVLDCRPIVNEEAAAAALAELRNP